MDTVVIEVTWCEVPILSDSSWPEGCGVWNWSRISGAGTNGSKRIPMSAISPFLPSFFSCIKEAFVCCWLGLCFWAALLIRRGIHQCLGASSGRLALNKSILHAPGINRPYLLLVIYQQWSFSRTGDKQTPLAICHYVPTMDWKFGKCGCPLSKFNFSFVVYIYISNRLLENF